jgi:hypothetical protein
MPYQLDCWRHASVPKEVGAGRIASTVFGRRHRPIRRIAEATPSLLDALVTPLNVQLWQRRQIRRGLHARLL